MRIIQADFWTRIMIVINRQENGGEIQISLELAELYNRLNSCSLCSSNSSGNKNSNEARQHRMQFYIWMGSYNVLPQPLGRGWTQVSPLECVSGWQVGSWEIREGTDEQQLLSIALVLVLQSQFKIVTYTPMQLFSFHFIFLAASPKLKAS